MRIDYLGEIVQLCFESVVAQKTWGTVMPTFLEDFARSVNGKKETIREKKIKGKPNPLQEDFKKYFMLSPEEHMSNGYGYRLYGICNVSDEVQNNIKSRS